MEYAPEGVPQQEEVRIRGFQQLRCDIQKGLFSRS